MEVAELSERAKLLVEYFLEIGLDDTPTNTGWRDTIEKVRGKKDLRGLQMINSDLNAKLRDLPPDFQERAHQRIAAATGKNLTDEKQKELRVIDAISERGRITTEDEYRLVHARVEEIYSDPAAGEEIEKLNRLLNTF